MPGTAFVLCLLFSGVSSFHFYARYIPNGDKVSFRDGSREFPWQAIGHSLPNAFPQLQRNDFGRAFARAGYRWTVELCKADSDGDGLTNGEELGDPACTWQYGQPHPETAKRVRHPGVDEGNLTFGTLPLQLVLERRLDDSLDRMANFYELVPHNGATDMTVENGAYRLRLGNRILYFLQYFGYPVVILAALAVRRSYGMDIKLWGVVASWFALWMGVSLGSHRLFSHQAFVPTRPFKCLLIFLAVMSGQGDPRYWAIMHRVHHNRCEHPGHDPHHPAPELERGQFGFAHGGFLYDRFEQYPEWQAIVPDLLDADQDFFGNGVSTFFYILLPLAFGILSGVLVFFRSESGEATADRVLRAAARGSANLAFYFYLPNLIAFQGTMLINSAVHMWGYTSWEDAMTEECSGKNFPLLLPFHLGEQNHNNHHADPTSISTWHRWWEVDFWPLIILALEFAGAVKGATWPRPSRINPEDPAMGARRGRLDLSAGKEIGFFDWRWDPLPIFVQYIILASCFAGSIKWRKTSLRSTRPTDSFVDFFIALFCFALIAHWFYFVLSSVELRTSSAWELSSSSAWELSNSSLFGLAVCQVEGNCQSV